MRSVKRSVKRKVKVFGRSIPVLAIVAIAMTAGLASAALVNYLSNTVTTKATVSSPIELSGKIEYWSAEQPCVAHGDAEAYWIDEPSHSGSFSAKLSVPEFSDTGQDWAYVLVPYELPISEFMNLYPLGWWVNATQEAGTVVLGIDETGNGEPDAWMGNDSSYWLEGEEGITGLWTVRDEWCNKWYEVVLAEEDSWMESWWFYMNGSLTVPPDQWAERFYDPAFPTNFGAPAGPFEEWGGWATCTDPAPVTGNPINEGTIVYVGLGYNGYLWEPTAFLDDIMIGGETYDLEPTIETYTFDGEPFDFYAGDQFHVRIDMTNHANQPIDYELVMVLEGLEGAWTPWYYGEPIDEWGYVTDEILEVEYEPWPEEIYVNEDGTHAIVLLHTDVIGSAETRPVDFEMYVNPALTPGEAYKFHVLVVPEMGMMEEYYDGLPGFLNGIIAQTQP